MLHLQAEWPSKQNILIADTIMQSHHPTPTPTPGNFDYPTPTLTPTPVRLLPSAVLVT